MDGAYAESSVKRENSAKITFYKALIILADIFIVIIGAMVHQLIVVLGLVAIVLTFLFLPYFNVEYECVYVNGEFEFSKIMNGSRRKTLLVIDMDNSDILAPANSHALDSYANNRGYIIKNYTAGKSATNVYSIIGKDSNGVNTRVDFQPSEKMLSLVKSNPTYRRKFSEY